MYKIKRVCIRVGTFVLGIAISLSILELISAYISAAPLIQHVLIPLLIGLANGTILHTVTNTLLDELERRQQLRQPPVWEKYVDADGDMSCACGWHGTLSECSNEYYHEGYPYDEYDNVRAEGWDFFCPDCGRFVHNYSLTN